MSHYETGNITSPIYENYNNQLNKKNQEKNQIN